MFTAHSLRHGAASHAALQGIDPETIRRWGRWRVPRSMDTYLQQVRALLLATAFPERLRRWVPFIPEWRAALASFVWAGRRRSSLARWMV